MSNLLFPAAESAKLSIPPFSSGGLAESLAPAITKPESNRVIPHAEAFEYHDALSLLINAMGGPDYRPVLGETTPIPHEDIQILISWSLSMMAAINGDPDGFAAWMNRIEEMEDGNGNA